MLASARFGPGWQEDNLGIEFIDIPYLQSGDSDLHLDARLFNPGKARLVAKHIRQTFP